MYLKLEAVTTCTFKQTIYNSVAFVNLFALVVVCIYTDNKFAKNYGYLLKLGGNGVGLWISLILVLFHNKRAYI